MSLFLFAWALCATVASFVVLGVVVVLEVRDRAASDRPTQVPPPRIPEQRRPTSAAAVVTVGDPAAFDAFLAELIVTPHVEEALSW